MYTEMAMFEYQGLYFCLGKLSQLGPEFWSLNEVVVKMDAT